MATQTSATPGQGYGSSLIDSLIWGCQWTESTGPAQGSISNPINITYSFGSGVIPGWGGASGYIWSSTATAAFGVAMNLIESACNIDFVQSSYTSNYSSQTNIVYYVVDSAFFGSPNILGMFEPPDGSFTSNYGYFNWQGSSWGNLTPGSDGFNTIIHELLHGVGLAHPHDGGGEADGTVFAGVSNSADTGDYGLNQGIWTVMSYNSDWDYVPGAANYSYGYGIMGALDIAALQAIYGKNTTYNVGSNTYKLPTSNTSGTGWRCLWDAGGVDTISNIGSYLSCY
jgi:serralysin